MAYNQSSNPDHSDIAGNGEANIYHPLWDICRKIRILYVESLYTTKSKDMKCGTCSCISLDTSGASHTNLQIWTVGISSIEFQKINIILPMDLLDAKNNLVVDHKNINIW